MTEATDGLLPDILPTDPMTWAAAWLASATERAVQRNPNAITLSTIDDGRPSSRIVLCKGFVADPGFLVFYTNYESRKGAEIAACSSVSVLFHWDALGRQVRLDGHAVTSPPAESDAYFAGRPRGSQLGAWGSDQSQPIAARANLKRQLDERAARFEGADVPRPPHWGGYRVWPHTAELWIEGADRIHDRARWTRELTPVDAHSFSCGAWTGTRLQP